MSFINPQTYTVRRRSQGEYVDGVWTETPDTLFTIKAGVQPLSGRELDLLDEQEGVLERGVLKMYTKTELFTIRQSEAKRPDVVEIDSELWEVHFSHNRSSRYKLPTAHFRYTLLRSDNQSDRNT